MFYLHIPKTGGQTLALRLASAFRREQSHFMQSEMRHPEDSEKLTELLKTRSFVESHVAGPLLQGRAGLNVLCTVRDPVAQMASNIRHILREPLNRWHRAANLLPIGEFLDRFGDFFQDHQTAYLISAFLPLAREIHVRGRLHALSDHLYSSSELVRWLVPTESIDDFVALWSIETKRVVPNPTASLNHAPPDEIDTAALNAALKARPHLYAFDSLLYEIAKERFAAYRAGVMAIAVPWDYPSDSTQAFSLDQTGIWLTRNWYAPEVTDHGTAWWSGPTVRSEVRFRREETQRYLEFDVLVVNGITHDDIRVKNAENFENLPITRVKQSASLVRFSASLDGLGREGNLSIVVPDCYAAILTTKNDNDLTRRSFLAANWKLAADPI